MLFFTVLAGMCSVPVLYHVFHVEFVVAPALVLLLGIMVVLVAVIIIAILINYHPVLDAKNLRLGDQPWLHWCSCLEPEFKSQQSDFSSGSSSVTMLSVFLYLK